MSEAKAVSEIARNAFKYAGGSKVEFIVEGESPQIFRTRISETGPGIADLPAVLYQFPKVLLQIYHLK